VPGTMSVYHARADTEQTFASDTSSLASNLRAFNLPNSLMRDWSSLVTCGERTIEPSICFLAERACVPFPSHLCIGVFL